MKYDITQEDKDIMERDLRNDRTLKHLRNLSFYKFTVGDVLVREEKYKDYNSDKVEWKVRLDNNNIPFKYVYVFENELGVGYIQRLSVNGSKLVEKPVCATEYDPDQTRFSLDPEYADHMLLSAEDEEFDTKSRYAEAKKKREQTHRKNKKIAVKIPDEMAALDWMKTLKVGDQIWWGHGISYVNKETYYIHEINLVAPPAPKLPPTNQWGYGSYQETFHPNIKIATYVPNGSTPTGYNNTLYAYNLQNYYVFQQRPFFADETIN